MLREYDLPAPGTKSERIDRLIEDSTGNLHDILMTLGVENLERVCGLLGSDPGPGYDTFTLAYLLIYRRGESDSWRLVSVDMGEFREEYDLSGARHPTMNFEELLNKFQSEVIAHGFKELGMGASYAPKYMRVYDLVRLVECR